MNRPPFRFTTLQLMLVMLGFAISAAIIGDLLRLPRKGVQAIRRFSGFVPERVVEPNP